MSNNNPKELIEFVGFKNNVLKHAVFFNIVNNTVDLINSKIPNLKYLKFDIELTQIICNAVLNSLTKKEEKMLDIIELYIAVFLKLFELNTDEIEQIKNQIEYLQANKKIKRTTVAKKSYKWFKSWIIKQVV
jgi:hypothetical protein